MGIFDEDLCEAPKANAISDAVYTQGGAVAEKAGRAAGVACFNFIHQHGLECVGLYHLHKMALDDITREDLIARMGRAATETKPSTRTARG